MSTLTDLKNAVKVINKHHSLSDAIYAVRDSSNTGSWDDPAVVEYQKALGVVKRIVGIV